MELITYYGMDKNPFIKDIAVESLYESNDFKQMTNRLEFIIRSRGIGVFLSNPGMGKTTCLRKTLESLNPSRYVVIYTPIIHKNNKKDEILSITDNKFVFYNTPSR